MVRNEEAVLPGCLQSTADLVNEIIVVDTGSTDRTKEIAASFRAKVFDFPWIDDFAAARNECIRHARRYGAAEILLRDRAAHPLQYGYQEKAGSSGALAEIPSDQCSTAKPTMSPRAQMPPRDDFP